MSAFASLENCRHRNQPCCCASSTALFSMPEPFSARGRQHHFRAEKTHQAAPFDTEIFGHDDDERIALLRAHHGQADAGVAAGRLDDRLSRPQASVPFGGLDDAEREPVLDGPERIERFDFHEQIDAFRRQFVDAHHGRVADCRKNAGVDRAAAGRRVNTRRGPGADRVSVETFQIHEGFRFVASEEAMMLMRSGS